MEEQQYPVVYVGHRKDGYWPWEEGGSLEASKAALEGYGDGRQLVAVSLCLLTAADEVRLIALISPEDARRLSDRLGAVAKETEQLAADRQKSGIVVEGVEEAVKRVGQRRGEEARQA